LNFQAIDAGSVGALRRGLQPALPLVGRLGRALWRASRARRSTWFDKTLLWRNLWRLNRLVGCLPRAHAAESEVDFGGGVRMRLDLSRLSDALCFVYGPGESEIGWLASRLCAADDAVLDVGANVGTTALFFARCVPRGAVHAFEPSAEMRTALARNLALSGIDNVTVHPFGLADAPSRGTLQVAHAGNPGSAFFTAGDSDGAVEVRVLDALDAVPAPAFVKIDVEGFELRVLRGGERTLAAHRPALVVEINDTALRRAGTDAHEVADLLRTLGYRLLWLSRGRLHALDPARARDPRLYNMLAVHPDNARQWAVARALGA
jgi:FkbM family methyltransferase